MVADVDAPRVSRARVAGILAVGVAVMLIVLALPDLAAVRSHLTGADPRWLLAAAVLELASCVSFVLVFRSVMCRRLAWRLATRLGMAVQGTNVLLPTGGAGGLALGGWALHRSGMNGAWVARRTVTLFAATSSINFVTALVAGSLLVTGAISDDVPTALAIGPAAAAALSIVAAALAPRLLERFSARLPGRLTGAMRAAAADGLRDVWRLARKGRVDAWAAAVGYMLFDLAALAAAFHAIGAPPSLGVLMIAYPLGQLGGLIPLPGGLGGADSGLVGALVLYGTPLSQAAAAVLAYRVFQLGIPAVLGAVALGGIATAVRRSPTAAARCAPSDALLAA